MLLQLLLQLPSPPLPLLKLKRLLYLGILVYICTNAQWHCSTVFKISLLHYILCGRIVRNYKNCKLVFVPQIITSVGRVHRLIYCTHAQHTGWSILLAILIFPIHCMVLKNKNKYLYTDKHWNISEHSDCLIMKNSYF